MSATNQAFWSKKIIARNITNKSFWHSPRAASDCRT